jgi:steroid 5-alpha reductase family enzyme
VADGSRCRATGTIVTATAVALIGFATIVSMLTAVWLLSLRRQDVSIVDVCWGLGFVLLAWLYVGLSSGFRPRALTAALFATLWGTRLAVHIFRRNRGKGEDSRYQAMRAAHGPAFWWRSLFVVFWLQAAILWFVALPLLVTARAAAPPQLTVRDGLGALLFAIGFAFESIGDYQLQRFKADRSNRGKVMDEGLWRYTRHPNYFGDATVWWGLYVVAAATPNGWLTMLSPALMTLLLMRVSGVTLLEGGLKASKPGYADYIARTSAFFPWFPRRAK